MKAFDALILTCEHATTDIPREYQSLFLGKEKFLNSHRGYDRGAFTIAQYLSKWLSAPLLTASVSRLLIDHNRSLSHPGLHWGPVKYLPESDHKRLINLYYRPFRDKTRKLIANHLKKKQRTLHLSIHSFTPVLRGKRRIAEIGLLYDPSRSSESDLSLAWRKLLAKNPYNWRVRRNYPYAGWTDGHTAGLRQQLPASLYAGIEIEINQHLVASHKEAVIAELLAETLNPFLRQRKPLFTR